jgi:hypothetical protein
MIRSRPVGLQITVAGVRDQLGRKQVFSLADALPGANGRSGPETWRMRRTIV